MADTEVEETLREIRERVLATATARATEHAPVTTTTTRNGGGGADSPSTQGVDATDALARMDANLSTTARAWSRLPPVLTYRRGAVARMELWLKRLIRRASHWFTWEQVNFNSAAHNALGDARSALDAQGRALAHLREELCGLREELGRLRADVETGAARAVEFEARVSSAESRFDSRLAELQGALSSGLDNLRGDQRAGADGLRDELRNELRNELRDELRDRADGLLEEQRVCFRQLSLEASELAVTHDRARRAVESRLEAMEKKVAE
ncbi:MAG: hypothetical protein ACJ74Q_21650 [Pyrinomonadaceae bacterium]